jgi:hypothetical protein
VEIGYHIAMPEPFGGTYVQQRREAQGKSRAVVVALLCGSLALVGYWFLFRSGYWDIRRIDVVGQRTLSVEAVTDFAWQSLDERASWRPWNSHNLLFLPQQYFTTQVREHFFLSGVTLERSWPSTLRLFIQERQTTFVLTDGRQSVVADMSGIITTTVSSTAAIQERLQGKRFADTWDLPVIKTDLEGSAEVGYQALSAQDAKRLLDLHMALNRRGVKMRYFDWQGPGTHEVGIATDKPFRIILNAEEDIDRQWDDAERVMAMKDVIGAVKTYIDVRIPGKLYYK